MNGIQRWTLLCGILLLQQSAWSQMRGWELGAWAGASNYFGDLNTNWRLKRLGPAGGLGARYNFNDRLAFKLGANYGQIAATDADSRNVYEQRRNLAFKSNVWDGTAQFEFNFMSYVHGHRDYYYSPYMFAGLTYFHFNPKAELDGVWYNLVDMGTEGQFRGEEYSTNQMALAYGFGFKLDLSYRWSINIDLSGRKVFTDYLDDVSGVYHDARDIRSLRGEVAATLADRSNEPKIGTAGRQRGNGKHNDAYAFVGVGLIYYFGQIRCPEFR